VSSQFEGSTQGLTTVLGLQGTVDYEVGWDPVAIGDLADRHRITHDELTTSRPVDDERSLLVTLLAFVRDGAGGECFVVSSAVVEEFATRMRVRITLGGTSVRAALAMRMVGLRSLLHLVSIDDHTRRLLPPDCAYLCSATGDTLDPHLIVQYPAGTVIRFGGGAVVAPHPNRVIFANDPPARALVLDPRLGDALTTARRFLISGFNAIQEPDVLSARLQEMQELLRRLPPDALVFYEDAGFHDPALSAVVRGTLAPHLDVYSLNEDEAQAQLGRRIDLLDPDEVLAALLDLHTFVGGPTVVLHTKYFSAAAGSRANDLQRGLDGGITMASTRYVHGDGMTREDYARTAAGARHPGGMLVAQTLESTAGDVKIAAVPAFTLDSDSPTTIGLGDTFVGGFMAALANDEDEKEVSFRDRPAALEPAAGALLPGR